MDVLTDAPQNTVLCLNAGSSSLKFALFACGGQTEQELASGSVDHLGSEDARATLSVAGRSTQRECARAGPREALDAAFHLLDEQGLPKS